MVDNLILLRKIEAIEALLKELKALIKPRRTENKSGEQLLEEYGEAQKKYRETGI